MSNLTPDAVVVSALSKHFGRNKNKRLALDRVSFKVQPGEMVALIGASGSGKSTLMRHIAGLVRGDGIGSISVAGAIVQDSAGISRDIRRMRRRIGFIFQQFNLVGRLSLLTNVLAGMIGNTSLWRTVLMHYPAADRQRAMLALARVKLADYASQRASTLSGGQQQRAAIARALVQGAAVILGDEPIASLDPVSAAAVMDVLARINQEDGVTVLVSLHQVDYARRYCPRTIALCRGVVVYDGPTVGLTHALLKDIYGQEYGAVDTPSEVVQPVAVRAPKPQLQPV